MALSIIRFNPVLRRIRRFFLISKPVSFPNYDWSTTGGRSRRTVHGALLVPPSGGEGDIVAAVGDVCQSIAEAGAASGKPSASKLPSAPVELERFRPDRGRPLGT
jgi:hypothetical protein